MWLLILIDYAWGTLAAQEFVEYFTPAAIVPVAVAGQVTGNPTKS